MEVENLPAGMMDHEEHVQGPKCDGLDAQEIARPDLRPVLPQERRQVVDASQRTTIVRDQQRLWSESRRNRPQQTAKLAPLPPVVEPPGG